MKTYWMRSAALAAAMGFVVATAMTSAAADFHEVSIVNSSSAPGAFNPQRISIPQGDYVSWTNNSSATHTSTGNSPLSLWNTGSITSEGTVDVLFKAAGGYPYHCDIHPSMTGLVRVPIERTPSSGLVGTQFTIKTASEAPTSPFVYDIQKRRGKNGTWKAWRTLSASNTTTFKPGSAGNHFFRGRLRNTNKDPDASSSWSPVRSVSVTS
ncbi:MAG TPA: hypothetical protein VF660_03205 [Actinomycetota bacterium]|jgi:plastocyanin